MDETRFDRITRLLAVPRSRRSAIKALFGGALAGTVTVLAEESGIARTCSGPGLVCREHANCCSGICGPKDRTGRRRCDCPPNQTACPPDGCVDLQTDPQHCGACGNVAETDRAQTCCNGTVTQLGTPDNCSTCGDNCANQGSGFSCFPTTDAFQCRHPEICTVVTTSSTSLTQITPFVSSLTSITPVSSSLTTVTPVESSLTVITPVVTSLTEVVVSSLTVVDSSGCVISSSFSIVDSSMSSCAIFNTVVTSLTSVAPVNSSLTTITPISSSLTIVTPVATSLTEVSLISTSLTEVVSSITTVSSSFSC